MKDRIWAVRFVDGTVYAYSEEQSAPAMPYVMEWDVEKELDQLRAELEAARQAAAFWSKCHDDKTQELAAARDELKNWKRAYTEMAKLGPHVQLLNRAEQAESRVKELEEENATFRNFLGLVSIELMPENDNAPMEDILLALKQLVDDNNKHIRQTWAIAAKFEAENAALREHASCQYARPGRGDCEHSVGLPGHAIPLQHDGQDDTVDCYGKPNGWCWQCWKSYKIANLEAENAALLRVVDAARDVDDLTDWETLSQSDGVLFTQLQADIDALDAGKDVPENSKKIYPCVDCGKMRSKDEGGTVFTVCEICWDKRHKKPLDVGKEE